MAENEEKIKKTTNIGFIFLVVCILLIFMFSSHNKKHTIDTSANTSNNNISTNSTNITTNTTIAKEKVTIIDFSQMSKEEIQNWCTENKVKCNITEDYSDTIEKGLFISQSTGANNTIYEGDTIEITYSLGKKASDEENNTTTSNNNDTSPKLMFGELQSFVDNPYGEKHICVIKAKIEPSYNNKATIHQNFFNVEDFIKHQNGNKYDEIQYWAVADMTSGNESKVISFTVNKYTIDNLYNNKIAANQLDKYVSDFWVIDSLK